MRIKEKNYLALINQNQALIHKVASIYTHNIEDRKDLVQEIYFQLWKSYDSFKGQSKKSTWLYRVCMNTSIQYLKKKNRTSDHKLVALAERHSNHNQLNDHDERFQNLLRSIQNLNELDKGIVLLYLEDKSHSEIAEITGLSVSNVGTRFKRIKDKLKKQNKS